MEKMSSFNDSSMHKMRKLTGFVNEYGENIPMKAKNCYILEGIKRIGGTRDEEMKETDERTMTAVMGTANLISGIVKMDPDLIQEGLTSLGELALDVYEDLVFEWFDTVSTINALSSSDFEKFKKQFLNHIPNLYNKKLKSFRSEDKENLTFFLTEALYRIASDLTRPKDLRIFCVDTLYEIQSKSNPFVWMKVSKDMKFHIINLILKISLLPQKNKEKL